jgi:hypothetical protein
LIALCGELAVEEVVDLLKDYWMNESHVVSPWRVCDNENSVTNVLNFGCPPRSA